MSFLLGVLCDGDEVPISLLCQLLYIVIFAIICNVCMSIQTEESGDKTAVTSWVTDPSQAKSLLQVAYIDIIILMIFSVLKSSLKHIYEVLTNWNGSMSKAPSLLVLEYMALMILQLPFFNEIYSA